MRRSIRGPLSLLISVIMVLSVFTVAFSAQANAASLVTIKIADVTKKYQEAASVLQLVNNNRTSKGLKAWTMDKDLLDQAMIEATELSFYGSVNSPSGINFTDSTSEEQ